MTVYVCFDRDIECGHRPALWCEKCPKRGRQEVQPEAAPAAQGGKTGWAPGMLQDDDRKLSRALANTPHARLHAREAADWAASLPTAPAGYVLTPLRQPAAQEQPAGDVGVRVNAPRDDLLRQCRDFIEAVFVGDKFNAERAKLVAKLDAAIDAAPLVSEPAVQVDAPLPPMPQSYFQINPAPNASAVAAPTYMVTAYTADQMREYVLADRRQRAAEQTEFDDFLCNTHPDAPHGFNRNASHNAGRYVCDCEGWTPEPMNGADHEVQQPNKTDLAAPAVLPLLPEDREALERDTARYRWLREQDWFDGVLCVLRDPKKVLSRGTGLGADCPSRDRLDAAIDAALSPPSMDGAVQAATSGGTLA